MKTEQEQIEKIQEIINDCYEFEPISTAISSDDRYVYIDTEEIAKAIVEAGYGEVSEYKAKIEDLKDEIVYLERKIAIRDNALKDSDKAIEMLEGKQDTIVKQAKIDVLNELREKYATSGSVNSNWATIIFVDDIDELIKEVENDK